MSKAILVIDTLMVDNKYICCDEQQSCPLWNKDKWCCEYKRNTGIKGCPLKPFPKMKLYVSDDFVVLENDFIVKGASYHHKEGYNACIDEMLGEEE